MAKRKYVKKSTYWDQFSKTEPIPSVAVDPMLAGSPYYIGGESKASEVMKANYSRSGSRIVDAARKNKIHKSVKKEKHGNIESGLLPYEVGEDGVSAQDSIELCQKAYANVAVFRNAIDIMAEFANSNLYLEGGVAKSVDFIYKWFDRVKMSNLKDQYFREYYRSGNIFLYRLDGKFNQEAFREMSRVYGEENIMQPGTLPVKYVMLNPYDISAKRATSFSEGAYFKVLSEYDIEMLSSPKTPYDQEVLDSLPPEVKKQIQDGNYQQTGLEYQLDPAKLSYSFYKKQDYEPFAIPFGYPVLEDINFKIELKKIDQAICRTIENVILLITMGAKPEDGGINPQNLTAMQELFKNESVGRVLVSDYTTNAEFVIPDLKKVLGPEKYEVVDRDIKDGLQNIIVGDERYSNTQVKAQIFLERLKEARNAFLNDFLQPQIKMICQNLGFRKYPIAKFEEIDIKDEVQLQRVTTRLLELGIITPEQGINAIRTGIYPKPEELAGSQQEYLDNREQGFFNPLVGGMPVVEAAGADEERKLKEKISEKSQQASSPAEPVNPPKESGRPTGSNAPQGEASVRVSAEDVKNIIYKAEELRSFASSATKEIHKKKRIGKNQARLLDELCESVIVSREQGEWSQAVESCIRDSNEILKLSPMEKVLEISERDSLDLYAAALYYHSKSQENDIERNS
tara:strand:- start:961 stop:3012 length:2052 start_codon:yes stop_codon:yes gene_type:complete